MAEQMVRQTKFTTGEVDEVNWKRTDLDSYITSAQSLKNVEITTTGLARKRKSTKFMADATDYSEDNSCMYEFIDNNNNYYILESMNEKFNVYMIIEGEVQFIQEVTTPYLTADLLEVDYTQDNDSVIFTHPLYRPGRIFISSYDTEPATVAFEYLDIYPLPAYDFNEINYNNFTVSLSVASTPPVITFIFHGVGADPGFDANWVGGQILGGGASPEQPLGYAIILTVVYNAGSGGTVTFTGSVQIPFETDPTLYAQKGSQYSIRQPMWSSSDGDPSGLGYPSKVLFYQNRLWLANTKSLRNTIAGSRINQPINFDVGTGGDADAIVYTIGQNDSGAIRWMNGGKQLEIFCDNYEFACPQDVNTALTPTTFSIRQQSSFGASTNLKPVTYINDSYFASKSGRALINFHYNGIGLTYVSSNVSAAATHLVKVPRNRALLRGSDQSQDNFIYFLNPTDDTLTAFQFAEQYDLAALTPITFQEDVSLIDIVTVNNEIYILKKYDLTETYTIEKFDLDLKIDSYRTASMASSGLVTGLSMFNGYTVQVVYENQDFGQYFVEDGEIIVDNPEEIVDTVYIGLLYDVEIIPMYPYIGSTSAPFFKNISRIYVDYFESLDFTINGKLVQYQNFADIQAGLPLQPKTDTAIFSPVSGWNRNISGLNDAIVIRQSSPFDLQILGIAYQIEVAVL